MRVLTLAGSQEHSLEEVDSELATILATLAADPGALDDHGRWARFLAELSLRVHAKVGSDPDLVAALQAIRGEERRSWTIWELANAHLVAGRLEDVEAIARFGLEEQRAAPTIEPRLWHVRAEAARLRGRWELLEECLERMEASIPAHSSYADDPGRARLLAQNHEYHSRLLQCRAQGMLGLGLLDQCRELAREAIREAELSGEPSALVAARLVAFDQAFLRGDADEAVELAVAGRADDRLAPWHRLFRVAEGMAEIERTREASFEGEGAEPQAARARAALVAALEAGLPRTEQLKAELGLCDLELVLGRMTDARAHLERARQLALDPVPSVGPSNESVLLAVLAWRLAHEPGSDPGELERCREALFVAYRWFLEQWESTPHRPGGIGFLHLAWRTQVVSEVIEAELSSAPGPEGTERAFERLLEAQVMGTLARERGLGAITIGEVRSALLPEGRGMLVLLPARDRADLFVLDQRTIEHQRIPVGRDALRERARKITAALQRPAGEVDPESLRRLHDDLLPQSVRERLSSWSGVTTVGFDLLCDLPFGILGGESGRPYGELHALDSLPSAALGVDLARRRKSFPRDGMDLVLVVASDPPPELGLQPWSFGERERERLFAPFEAQRVALVEGQRVSRNGLLDQHALFRSARVVHFLTHGTVLQGRENSSALVLSRTAAGPERLFTAEDVAQLELGGLVILSACGSGRGPARTGDDRLINLGGAFLEAGARCVILARFPVEYEATLALMERLHAHLAAGDSPAEALRAARAQRERGDVLAAFHAAAFEVLGMGFEPVF